jgi:hypothetical protein
MARDPKNLDLPANPPIDEAWLRRLPPRRELVARYALRGLFHARLGADRRFSARVDELRALLDLDEDGLAAIMIEVRALKATMEKGFAAAAAAPPERPSIRNPSRPSSATSAPRRAARKTRKPRAGAKPRGRRPIPHLIA